MTDEAPGKVEVDAEEGATVNVEVDATNDDGEQDDTPKPSGQVEREGARRIATRLAGKMEGK